MERTYALLVIKGSRKYSSVPDSLKLKVRGILMSYIGTLITQKDFDTLVSK